MEIGPRSLGNRSILADPTRKDMKDKINAEVKHREAYRPFAPSVPVEAMNDYFDSRVQAPFMLKVCYVKPDQRETVPAITHVDGSARMQTVRSDINPLYHSLLTEFGKCSGVPVLLNTSFNVMGEPIVGDFIDVPGDVAHLFVSFSGLGFKKELLRRNICCYVKGILLCGYQRNSMNCYRSCMELQDWLRSIALIPLLVTDWVFFLCCQQSLSGQ